MREAARGALAQLSEWLERAGAGGRAGAARNRILEGPTLDALARLRPGSAAALADLRDVPRLSRNKRKQYGDAIVAALAQARAAGSASLRLDKVYWVLVWHGGACRPARRGESTDLTQQGQAVRQRHRA